MTKGDASTLADRLEGGDGPTSADIAGIAAFVGRAFPGHALWDGADAGAAGSSDDILSAIASTMPSWSVHISGHSGSIRGRWTCTIRETGVRDDDELIGVGRAATLQTALLAAFLRVIDLKAPAG